MVAPYMSAQEFLGRARQQIARWKELSGQTRALDSEHRARKDDLKTARDKALADLVLALLPALNPTYYPEIRNATGYAKFLSDDPQAWIERRRAELDAQIQKIDATPEFLRADELINRVTGEYTIQMDQVNRDLEPIEQTLRTYESEPRLMQLIHSAYDTEAYAVRWWQWQYYQDWKYGDVYTERFNQNRFADVRENYHRLRAGRGSFEAQRQQINAKIRAVQTLIDTRAAALYERDNLEQLTLDQCRKKLREHLEYIDRTDLADRATANPDRLSAIKRLHGIEKKIEYLDEYATQYLTSEQRALSTASAKLQRKVDKFSRPKNAYAQIPRAEAEGWLRDPSEKIKARRYKYTRNYDSVYGFDSYDRYDYARDWLWWDLMTDGRIDGDFIPEVHAWRGTHPDAQWSRDDDFHRAGALYAQEADDPNDLLEVS